MNNVSLLFKRIFANSAWGTSRKIILLGMSLVLTTGDTYAGLIFGRINIESSIERIEKVSLVCNSAEHTKEIILSPDGGYKVFLDEGFSAQPCELVVQLSGGDVVSAYIKSYADEEARYEFDIVKIDSTHQMYRR